jgi:hypothetical protein
VAKRRIPFVDDDDSGVLGRFSLMRFLIETARDGREALVRLATFPADLVVTDLEMPGMNSWRIRPLVAPGASCLSGSAGDRPREPRSGFARSGSSA